MVQVVASILSADLARLGEQVHEAQVAGADRIQVDVMDGHFVPNITFGPGVVEAVRRVAPGLPIEAHLMVERPERFIDAFAAAGADYILIQVESTHSLYLTLHAIPPARSTLSPRRAAARGWFSTRQRRWKRWVSWSPTSAWSM